MWQNIFLRLHFDCPRGNEVSQTASLALRQKTKTPQLSKRVCCEVLSEIKKQGETLARLVCQKRPNSAGGLARQPHPPTIAHSKMNRNIFCRICFHLLNYCFWRVLRKSVKNSTTRARIKNVFIHLHNKIMRVLTVNFDGLPLSSMERGKFNENGQLAISVHLKTTQIWVVIHGNKHNSIL